MCNECVRKKVLKKRKTEVEEARSLRLKQFTPRELMCELKSRGFTFTMEFKETVTRTIK